MPACDPNTLAAAASGFARIPTGMLDAVATYLLAVWAGGTMDVNTLIQNAKEFQGKIPPGAQPAVQTYLLAQIAGGSADPTTLLQAAKSMQQLRGLEKQVIVLLLCTIAQP